MIESARGGGGGGGGGNVSCCGRIIQVYYKTGPY